MYIWNFDDTIWNIFTISFTSLSIALLLQAPLGGVKGVKFIDLLKISTYVHGGSKWVYQTLIHSQYRMLLNSRWSLAPHSKLRYQQRHIINNMRSGNHVSLVCIQNHSLLIQYLCNFTAVGGFVLFQERTGRLFRPLFPSFSLCAIFPSSNKVLDVCWNLRPKYESHNIISV